MSSQIDTALVKQYKDNVELLVQQKGSVLREAVMTEGQGGEETFFDRLGPTAVVEITTRHGDSPQVDTPHDRRRSTLRWFDWGDFIDKEDRVKSLKDFNSPYALNAAYAQGRNLDDLIIAAATGTAYTGKAGGTAVTFPAGQQIAHGSADLTLAKLITAKKLFHSNDVDLRDPMNELHIAIGADQLEALLNDTTVTSADYNTIRLLMRGDVDTFMGMKFHHSQRLAVASQIRSVLVWAKSGLKVGIGEEMTTRITERADKRFNTYVYVRMGFSATRMEEEKVVEILCDESA